MIIGTKFLYQVVDTVGEACGILQSTVFLSGISEF